MFPSHDRGLGKPLTRVQRWRLLDSIKQSKDKILNMKTWIERKESYQEKGLDKKIKRTEKHLKMLEADILAAMLALGKDFDLTQIDEGSGEERDLIAEDITKLPRDEKIKLFEETLKEIERCVR